MSAGSAAAVSGTDSAPHFVLVPMMAAGHAGPMLDMARTLSGRGALVTFVTTPLNLPRLGRAPSDGALPIRFLPLRFPCAEAGLPEGCESLDALPGLGLLRNFNDACAMLRGPLVALLRDREGDAPPASCVVSDACHPWTGGVARELGVPRFSFDGFCAFSSLCMRQMNLHRIFEGVDDDDTRPLVEIGHGLEATKRPFIWVVKPGNLAEFERWLSEDGFESRVGETGLVIRDWAPQKAILSHPATGAFVTHCGWNSVLECVAAGLPMVSCPHFAEQFMNEKLVVDVLRVGVPVGVKGAAQWGVEAEGVLATRQDVEGAVAAVMDCGEEGSARRARAAELGRKAREAVVHGGSSFRNVALLIQHVQQRTSTRNPWIEKKPSDRR
ncbi:Anthocyanidin 3-O-glucosyltransferase 4 [Zea mays]|uniref:Anthocyanidin 3-O-glucosyltransferase 4 n=1 Tax=Zea mays TaxID=4577 RepID=A0A3L6EPJ4_MAIZE|nr:Anthocyanidin 3-O-glucosyltransferase 4 [Zea mays]